MGPRLTKRCRPDTGCVEGPHARPQRGRTSNDRGHAGRKSQQALPPPMLHLAPSTNTGVTIPPLAGVPAKTLLEAAGTGHSAVTKVLEDVTPVLRGQPNLAAREP